MVQRHSHIGMADELREDCQRYAAHYRMARHGMAKIAKTHIFYTGFPPNAVPESGVTLRCR